MLLETKRSYFSDCAANLGPVSFSEASGLGPLGPDAEKLLDEISQAGDTVSEDCLTLNVWTKPQTGEKAKAVLFWIYGGGFQAGNTNNPAYDGEYFADDQDVVVVSAKSVNCFPPSLAYHDKL